jgi:hypothetical protein
MTRNNEDFETGTGIAVPNRKSERRGMKRKFIKAYKTLTRSLLTHGTEV